ncbi:MAG: hypothetical protein HY820_35970 [Acidobacteria bacterium]|nr:hypothetical protein [Acidobacteriota bacterium]
MLPLLAALLLAPPAVHFEKSEVCASCHLRIAPPRESAMGADEARSIAPVALWSGSMMAFSAKDPYWLAKVKSEVAITPAAKAVIEDKCLRCHAPVQQYPMRLENKLMPLSALDSGGREGVTCTVCHQISPEGLGKRESFTGGFQINARNEIYGPHAKPFQMPMEHHTGYTPVQSRHVLESSLCATCHTVITPTLNDKGEAIGEFVEQAPYLEWLASGYPRAGKTCQSCHMPRLQDRNGKEVAQYIAHNPMGMFFPPTQPRTPYGMHTFAGGNYQLPRIMAEIYPEDAAVLEQTERRATASLKGSVALRVATQQDGDTLRVRVTTVNRTGHKLPTAFPSRRLWLHVNVRGESGPVFESGAWDAARGEIAGGANQPHRQRIDAGDQAAIYEAEYRDVKGAPTTSLLRAAGYRKDNRILPLGFDAKAAMRGIEAVGVAGDPDFVPGSDTVEYVVRAPRGGKYQVKVEALFQNLKPHHLTGLDAGFTRVAAKHAVPLVIASSCPPVPAATADGHPCP